MKTFVKVKRGILSPKHYNLIGSAIWLYLLIIDRADWETGIYWSYTDGDASDLLGIKVRTIRSWRYRLENGGYISSKKAQHSLTISVSNWDNPDSDWSQSDMQSDIPVVHSSQSDIQSDMQSDIQSDMQPQRENVTLQLPESESESRMLLTDGEIQKVFVKVTGLLTFPSISRESDLDRLRAIAAAHNSNAVKYCSKFWVEWNRRGYSKSNTGWLDWAIADDIPSKKGRNNGTTKKPTQEPTYTPEQHKQAEKIARRNVERLRANR